MDFESLAKDLSNEQLDLTPGMLGQLSGLSREENEQIAEVFADIPALRRRKILTSLVAMSDDNIELDFLGVFCSSLADSEPDIRILAASGLWETTDRNAIAPLINTLEADQSLDVRAAAAIALAHFVELYVAGKLIERDGKKLCESLNCILEDQNIEFDQIVVCAGAWSNYIANMIGDDFPLDTERGYHVLFESDKNIINRPVGWSQSGFYLIQIEDGIRAAGTVEIAGLTKPPNTNRLKMIEREARKILPQLKNVKSTWMGNRPTLPDSLPIIGKSNKNENVLYAFGHQHIGWTLAAVTGKAINELIKGSQPNFNISYFSPERFNK